MKLPVALFIGSLVCTAFAGSDIMQEAQAPAEIPRDSAKAVLVIHSNTGSAFNKAKINYYLDDNLIGQDKTDAYFITRVDPGTHWIFFNIDGESRVFNTGRLIFEPGKIYYLLRLTVPFGIAMTTQSPEDFKKYLADCSKTKFYTFIGQGKGKQLKPDRIEAAKKAYEEELIKDPKKHEDQINYKGF
jgi:hypothetical protein